MQRKKGLTRGAALRARSVKPTEKRAEAKERRAERRRRVSASGSDVLLFAKKPPKRDRKFRNWTVKQPCLLTDLDPTTFYAFCRCYRTHFAHVPTGTRGTGMKGDDEGVPLCGFHHGEQHTKGLGWFESHYDVQLRAEAARYRRRFEEERA